ncbi:MAG: TonB-dependent receptor, partial [Akkermansiaceae bacterium]|nr:TonB-dependent receptor [Akkermansiaceae bacterium]
IGINRTEDTWLNSAEPFKVVSWLGYDDPAEKYGLRMTGIYSAAVNHVDDTTNQGKLFRPDAWFTMDLSVYWKPTDTFTVNAGLNNIFDEKYWSWSSARRGMGISVAVRRMIAAQLPARIFISHSRKYF